MNMENDKIEQLKRKLYSRGGFTPKTSRFQMSREDSNVKDNWEGNTELHLNAESGGTHPFLKKFLIGAVLFFVVALGLAAYVFTGGMNEVSSANVDIGILGPASVASGEQVDLGISIVNKNSTRLENVVLSIEYPEGTKQNENDAEPLKRTSENMGQIDKGSVRDSTAKFILFGDKGVVKTLTFKIEYTVTGSNARFTKEKKYDVMIGSSPLLVNVSAPQEINSGQLFGLQVTVTSNSGALLKDVLVKVEYPYGFTYVDSSLEPERDKQTWNIGDLKNGEKKVFTVQGKIVAQDNEERTFRFVVGTLALGGEVDTVLGTAMPTLLVRKPFFNADFVLAGESSEIVSVSPRSRISGAITITNSLADALSNVSVEVKMSGSALNKTGVRVNDGGFYQSNQNTIVWDRNSRQNLEIIRPGEKVGVNFDLDNFIVSNTDKNPEVSFDVTLKGVRALSGGGVDNVTSTFTKKLRFLTGLSLGAKTLRSGVISNIGPVPPQREVSSTYTVEWTLSNTNNDAGNTQVTTVLPVYVEWTGAVSPTTESISYNPDTRTVTWNAGTIPARAGYSTSPKKVFFQVKLNPSASQVGIAPALTGTISTFAKDMFADKTFTVETNAVTSNTSDGFSGTVQ
ncbi:MAG: hypothetical protein NTV02_01040 [Candidatus Zambryskibacteria bacterium]|nr:hypothetical protein [Candidatus Zambryskibacteria bacterium]